MNMLKSDSPSEKKHLLPLNKKAFISLVALLALSLLLLLGIYFATFILTEYKMSRSYSSAAKTYYLAEAGLNEAIWKLKNDDTTADGDDAWKDKFVTEPDCDNWQASFERTGALFENSSYTVTIQNSSCAKGEIISTAQITLPNGKTTQRVVKTKVFKALNPSPVEDSALFTGGPSEVMTVRSSLMNTYDGNLFSNNNVIIKQGSTLNIYDDPNTSDKLEGKIMTVNNITVSSDSTLNSTAQCAKNICQGECEKCPPDVVSMPMIDFDSDDPNSYKSKAKAAGTVYTSSEFGNLLWLNQNLTLDNEVTYVTGPIELKGGQDLIINGVLVADGSISIGKKLCWTKSASESRCGNSKITINHIAGKPAGLLTKNSISISSFTLQINIVGLIYATDKLNLVGLPETIDITGGMMARKISIISVMQGITTYEKSIVDEVIGNPTYSPIVTIEHWEETY